MARAFLFAALTLGSLCLSATTLHELQYQASSRVEFPSSSCDIGTALSSTIPVIDSGSSSAAKEEVVKDVERNTIIGVVTITGAEVAGLESNGVNSMSAEESTLTEANIDTAAGGSMASTTDGLTDTFPRDDSTRQNGYQNPTTLTALHKVTREPSFQELPSTTTSVTPEAKGASFSTTIMGTHPTCMSNGIAFDCGPTPTHAIPNNAFPTATVYRPNPADMSRYRDLSCPSPRSNFGVTKKVMEVEIQKVCSHLSRVWDPRTDADGNTITYNGILPGGKQYRLFAMFTQPGHTVVDFSIPVCKAGFQMPFENCKADKDGLFRGGSVTLGLGKGGRESEVLFKVMADWPPKVERRSVNQAETSQVSKDMEPRRLSIVVQHLSGDAGRDAMAPASVTTTSKSS